MKQDQIELKQRRDTGDIISIYFDFFKQNLKPFLNIFIAYNGIFLLGFIGVSYLMVTGFVGTFRTIETGTQQDMESTMLLGFGFIAFLFMFLITAVLNYSLAASYMINYERSESFATITRKHVWQLVSNQLGSIIVFVILLVLIYIAVFIVGVILSFIPLIGTLAYYLILLAYTSWMGLSFMAMMYEKRSVTDALGEGWRLLTKYFWKSILVNLAISILLAILILVVLMIPGVLIGIYAFHSMETGVDLVESPVASVVWTIALSIVLFLYTFNQSLSQFTNGVLYFSLHEETYNENTRKRIDQIGVSE